MLALFVTTELIRVCFFCDYVVWQSSEQLRNVSLFSFSKFLSNESKDEEYFDEQPDNTLIEEDDLPPNEVLVNALKKYKESRGDMEKLTPNEVKDRIVNQPPKPPKTNIKRID